MRRLLRHAFTLCSAISLVLCVAFIAGWAWGNLETIRYSRHWVDESEGDLTGHIREAVLQPHGIELIWWKAYVPNPITPDDSGAPERLREEVRLLVSEMGPQGVSRGGPRLERQSFLKKFLPEWAETAPKTRGGQIRLRRGYMPHFIPLIVFGTLALCHFRPRRRRGPGVCPTCGYDLRAHAKGERCPECGTAVG